MKEDNKNIENLIDKMMAESSLQSPSIDFTLRIMSQVLAVESNKIKAYKPLISKEIWILIIGALIFCAFNSVVTNSSYDLRIDELYSQRISNLFSGIQISKKSLYIILIVPVMILIQIPLLKNYYYKKYHL
ncbi:hypothetical protein [Flavobacterium sp. 5]|uniref:hypothetical protein n=1 Tax=Flavobacterium sp. 5 TaxID=2035199 RepID=UPI000C2B6902|nr:hypothetical protein [Flavobacterium sp. 5]PKB16916.1 hypothetical protein CLU82_2071 [Flavobacterium sp. 5]